MFCTGTAIISLLVLASVVVIHLLFSSMKSMTKIEEPFLDVYTHFQPFADSEQMRFLKSKIKLLSSHFINDREFLIQNPHFVVDMNKGTYIYFYSDRFTNCKFHTPLIENTYSIMLLENISIVPIRKCVFQIKVDRINADSVKMFIKELMREPDIHFNESTNEEVTMLS